MRSARRGLLLLVATGCGAPCAPESGVVAAVIDGDTLALASGERVRLLLVDAPELASGECFGDVAARAAADLVLGRRVELTYDAVCSDAYGRLLAHVSVDGRDAGRLLVERGYACVLHIPPAGDDRVDDYRAIEDAARAGRRGLWAACPDRPC